MDKIANLDTIVAQLSEKVDWLTLQSRESAEIKPQIEELTQENNMLQATVDAQSASLEELLMLINGLRSAGATPPTVKSVDKATKAVCDNVFNVSSCMTFINICTYRVPECNTAHLLPRNGDFRFQAGNVIGCP
jgi:hypothetical protein